MEEEYEAPSALLSPMDPNNVPAGVSGAIVAMRSSCNVRGGGFELLNYESAGTRTSTSLSAAFITVVKLISASYNVSLKGGKRAQTAAISACEVCGSLFFATHSTNHSTNVTEMSKIIIRNQLDKSVEDSFG